MALAYEEWDACGKCRLRETRQRVVFGDGPVPAPLVVIGEAPGDTEDQHGTPFIGRPGNLLRGLFLDLGVKMDEQVFSTNLCGCKTPQGRVPMPDEIEECRSRIAAILDATSPKAILLLGATASIAMAGIRNGITRARGKWTTVEWSYKGETFETPAMPTLHPAGVIRSNRRDDRDRLREDIRLACQVAGIIEATSDMTSPDGERDLIFDEAESPEDKGVTE